MHVTHRLEHYRENQSKPRTTVGPFEKLKDKNRIRRAAKKRVGKLYGISDQILQETAEKRKELCLKLVCQ